MSRDSMQKEDFGEYPWRSVGEYVKETEPYIAYEDTDLLIERDDDENQIWVNSAVKQTDDPNTPAMTGRTIFLGCSWAIFYAVANALFSFRANPFVLPIALATLMTYPMGLFLAKVLPDISVFGLFSLNPGPFSVKEHALIILLASAAGGAPYGIDNVVGQRYSAFLGDRSITFFNSLPWILSTQFIGYGLAGLGRRFLVKPKAMFWPSILPTVALLNSFHETKPSGTETYKLSRYSFFWLAFCAMFLYEFFPLYITPVLSMVSILCLITTNRTARSLGSSGAHEGTGLLALSFDWSVLSAVGPITTPFSAMCNIMAGYVFFSWILVPIIHYTNPFNVGTGKFFRGYVYQSIAGWGSANASTDPFPNMNAASIFDRFGQVVPVSPYSASSDNSGLLNADFTLNNTFYEAKGPFYLTANFTVGYITSFLSISAVFSHVALWYGRSILSQFREAVFQVQNKDQDVHNRLMAAYPEVPDWFYLAFLGFFSMLQLLSGIFTAYQMPWWSTLFAIFLGMVYTIPIGIVQAISGVQIGLNVLTEFVIGLLLPGQLVTVMCFKSLGYNMVIQALSLTGDLKIGHYMHISPRSMFVSQLIGTAIGALLNLGVAFWAESNFLPQVASDPQWDIQSTYGVFVNAGGIWGAIGPQRFFGIGSPYSLTLWAFPIGALAPLIPWTLHRFFPHRFWEQINFGILSSSIPTVQNQAVVVVPFLINFVFNRIVFIRKREWWEKYAFILSIAFDSSTAVAVFAVTIIQIIFPTPIGPNIFAPAGSLDYYCLERSFQG
ncbi:hypothetical protein HDU91_001606 [Kappamyces sp. JEL0680]|nr:hypothetical protein HDU91_001606 [Kappamyces sp. JEL0680]